MDLYKAFVGSVLAGGVDAFKMTQEKGIAAEYIDGQGRTAWDFVCEYYRQFKDLPSPEVIEGKTNVRLELPKEPAEFYANEILNARLHGQIIEKVEVVSTELQARDPQKAYEAYTTGLTELRKEGLAVAKTISLPTLGPEFLKYYDLIKAGHRGVETPWPTINDTTLGFWPEDFILYVARLGVGKTWTLAQIMIDAWFRQNKRVLFVTTEMSQAKILQRTYALQFKLPYDELRRGKLGEFSEKRLREGIEELKDREGLYIIGGDFDFTMDGLEAAIDESEPDIVIVDGAYLIKTTGGDGRTEKAANSFDELKRCAKRNHVPLVASTQFNREAKANKSDSVSVEKIALSDAAGWNADLIFGLVQTEEMKKDGRMIQKPLKFREGIGEDILCNWNFELMDFSEIPKDFDLGSAATPQTSDLSTTGGLFDGTESPDDDGVPF